VLRHFNLADSDPSLAAVDERLREHYRNQFALVRRPSPAAATTQ